MRNSSPPPGGLHRKATVVVPTPVKRSGTTKAVEPRTPGATTPRLAATAMTMTAATEIAEKHQQDGDPVFEVRHDDHRRCRQPQPWRRVVVGARTRRFLKRPPDRPSGYVVGPVAALVKGHAERSQPRHPCKRRTHEGAENRRRNVDDSVGHRGVTEVLHVTPFLSPVDRRQLEGRLQQRGTRRHRRRPTRALPGTAGRRR
jgi:hypothetical protein